MPRPPKAPGLRARRNKASTRAKLRAGHGVRPPALPIRGCACGGPPPKRAKRKGSGRRRKATPPCAICVDSGVVPWNVMVVTWWRRLWASPMAEQFIESDLDPLFVLASLKDEFWTRAPGDAKLAAEIRQQESRFGLTPLDRRKLEWELERSDEDEASGPSEPPVPVVDPRAGMRLVR